jgi:hypothetical protein
MKEWINDIIIRLGRKVPFAFSPSEVTVIFSSRRFHSQGVILEAESSLPLAFIDSKL